MILQPNTIALLALPIPGGFYACEAFRHFFSNDVNDHPKAKRDLAISALFLAAGIGSALTTQNKIAGVAGANTSFCLSACITLVANVILGRFAMTDTVFSHPLPPLTATSGG